MNLSDGRSRERHLAPFIEVALNGAAEFALHNTARHLRRESDHLPLQTRQLPAEFRREHIDAEGEELPHLDPQAAHPLQQHADAARVRLLMETSAQKLPKQC